MAKEKKAASWRSAMGGVAGRMAGGYLLLIVFLGVVSVVGVANIEKLRSTYDRELNERVPRLTDLQHIQEQLAKMGIAARDALLFNDAGKMEQALATIESGRQSVGKTLEALQKAIEDEGTPTSKELAQEVGTHTSAVLIGLVKFSRYAKAEKREQALEVLNDALKPQMEQLAQHIAEYQALQIAGLKTVQQDVVEQEKRVKLQAALIAAGAITLAALLAFGVIRSVVLPLRQVKSTAGKMARGDFTTRMEPKRRDEVGDVIVAFNEIADGLSLLVSSIREGVSEVNTVAENISTRNVRIETRAAEQTKSLNAAMDFIRGVQAGIEANVGMANRATTLASNMAGIAQESSISVRDAVDEMARVKQSSQKITDIISLIDGIAFQTNILALNAAVEAARAGEQGRGFAVVASEVRSLAGRSAEASKEIKTLILSSQAQVDSGTSKVQSITQVMDRVIGTSSQLQSLVEQISSDSKVQGLRMNEMVDSVVKLESGNDNNLHIVGGMRMTLADLRETSAALEARVAEFKTLDAGTTAPQLENRS